MVYVFIAALFIWNLLLTFLFVILAIGIGRVKQVQEEHLAVTATTTTIMNVNFKAILSAVKALGDALRAMGGSDAEIPRVDFSMDPPPSGSMKN